jgi:hypothetical protein
VKTKERKQNGVKEETKQETLGEWAAEPEKW